MPRLAGLPLRRLCGALTLLGLLLAGAGDAVAHVDAGLHAQRFTVREELTSDCSRQHPPSFERHVGTRDTECPACLLQLQQRGTAQAASARPSIVVIAASVAACEPAARLDRPRRHAAPRGPPLGR